MNWTIPGTVLTMPREDAVHIEEQFRAMFLAGGIVLSQVSGITGLEPYTVQNWVKRGFLSPPDKKRYSLRQLCRILNINMLRGSMPIDRICHMLSFVNGDLSDESDDMIDDSQLYFLFVQLAARLKELYDPKMAESVIAGHLQDYEEPVPGARERVAQVLRIMLTAHLAARLMQETEKMLGNLH